MSKKSIKKLTLNKETVRLLSDKEDLRYVVGGTGLPCTQSCLATCGCTTFACASQHTEPCDQTGRPDTCACPQC
jgi:hypothetical protein